MSDVDVGRMPGPLEHPGAWRAADLQSDSTWKAELTHGELAEVFASTIAAGDCAEPIDTLTLSDFPWPELGARLRQVQHDLEHGRGLCLLRGLPIGHYNEAQARRIFWGLALHVGTPVSQSAAGERIFSVRDEGYAAGDARVRGPNTSKRLSFHTDRCDVIAFLCLKQARSGGENQVVSSMTLYNEMLRRRPDLLAVLLEPFYYLRHNVDTGNERPWCRQPIFSFHEGHFAASFLRVLIERAHQSPDLPAMSETQREALDYLEALAAEESLHITFRQEPGDVLLVNNWTTFHRRAEFEDFADPAQRRHLL
ncbi:MAG: TauD/TfdA family dioxygenase, partial [Planctomycetales bacterium]|nr:TauD/TfdA family dioxygenase [Planctomycetales bacterium]